MSIKVDVINLSDNISETPHNNDDFFLITQFYISSNKERHHENLTCLKRNIQLNLFKKIYLVNEKKYTKEELNLSDEEMNSIHQIIFDKGCRMRYSHPLALKKALDLNGYLIISNTDIFFDITLLNLRKTSLSIDKAFYALLRFEYNNNIKNLKDCKLFTNDIKNQYIPYSQDVWIIHTNFMPNNEQIKKCNFELGKLGCDNHITFLFSLFGYKIYNEPYVIKTYHYHTSQFRTYLNNPMDKINPPYLFVKPIIRD
jgi:hypothetical protein